MNKSFWGIATLAGVVGTCVTLVTMVVVAPRMLGPIGVTLWFLLLMASLGSLGTAASYFLGAKMYSKVVAGNQKRDALRRGVFFAGYSTILLALSSLQQLNMRDALLLLLLLALAEFYAVARR